MAESVYRINIARDFSKVPFGRYPKNGEFSGERFRQEHLLPALAQFDVVVVELDGVFGFGSSFLDESFGGLVREEGMRPEEVARRVQVQTEFDDYRIEIRSHIERAAG